MKRFVLSTCAVMSFGIALLTGCDNGTEPKDTPKGLDTAGRVTILQDRFEGDPSKWRSTFLFNAMEAPWPQMKITTAAYNGGTHSVMGDSNRTALYYVMDQAIPTGIVGMQFFIMATTPAKVNLSVKMGKDRGSSGGLNQEFGIGFDTSNSIISILELPDDPSGIGYYNEKHGAIQPGKWYKCVVEANHAIDSVTYYINDKKVRTAHFPLATSMGIDGILVIRDKNGENGEPGVDGPQPYYVDDVHFYKR